MISPADFLCTSFTNQILVWLNLKQPEEAFDLLFCFVLGNAEGSFLQLIGLDGSHMGWRNPRASGYQELSLGS